MCMRGYYPLSPYFNVAVATSLVIAQLQNLVTPFSIETGVGRGSHTHSFLESLLLLVTMEKNLKLVSSGVDGQIVICNIHGCDQEHPL